jgi:hypothetical protein
MKQKHVFLVSIDHDENENHISIKVVQGPIKKDFETEYVVDDNGNDHWVSKEILKKFEVVKNSYLSESCEKPIVEYTMGFIWEDDADEHFVRYMADECQRRCKLPVLDRLDELRNEINRSIEKLIETKTCVWI